MKSHNYFKKGFIVLITMLTLSAVCTAEEITLTTYYPSPYGVYSEMRLFPKSSPNSPCGEGTIFYDSDAAERGLKVCDGSGNPQSIGGGYWVPGDVVGDIRNINLSGDVGIGLTNPQARLDVSGLVRTDNFMDAASFRDVSNTAYYLDPSNAGTSLLTLGSAGIGVAPASRLSVNGGISAGAYASTAAPANGMIISGNVGIGTTGPGYKLDVLGDIRAQGWLRTIGGTGWISDSYGGGWFMQDASWIRAYNNKGVYTAGEVQAGTVRGNSFLCIGGDCRNVWPSGGGGSITINGPAGAATGSTFTFNGAGVSQSGSTFTFSGGGAGIGGSGTANYVPKFTGSTSLGNSQIYDNGSYVGIGTTGPSAKLHVANDKALFYNIAIGGAYPGYSAPWPYETIGMHPTNNLRFYFGSTQKFALWSNGDLRTEGVVDTGDVWLRNSGKWASQAGLTSGQRYTIYNSGGGKTLTQALGTWSFCMIVEHMIRESGGSTNDSCRIDGSLNGGWTLVSYVGNSQDGQCSAFCVK